MKNQAPPKVTVALILFLGACLVPDGSAHATVRDLRTGELQKSDVPAGLVGPRVRIYTRFHSEMKIVLSHTATSSSSSGCTLPAGVKKDGWRRGVVEVFLNARSDAAVIGVCVSQFKTAAGAHLAFRLLSRGVTAQVAQFKSASLKVKIHTTPKVGNESLNLMVGGPGVGLDGGQFRRDDVLVQMSYLGSHLTESQFDRLLAVSNSRLR